MLKILYLVLHQIFFSCIVILEILSWSKNFILIRSLLMAFYLIPIFSIELFQYISVVDILKVRLSWLIFGYLICKNLWINLLLTKAFKITPNIFHLFYVTALYYLFKLFFFLLPLALNQQITLILLHILINSFLFFLLLSGLFLIF